ncbi:MAG: zf-HC2 domain-containing protein [Candidatus Omnitrophota bacterium]
MKIENVSTDCLNDVALSDYLLNTLPAEERSRIEKHLSVCGACLVKMIASSDSVREFEKASQVRRFGLMKKMNWICIAAAVSFVLSFLVPRYFLQFLTAAAIFGVKWIVDSKNTRILIAIHEAWKKGGEKEASKVLKGLDKDAKSRL